ncbi:hypothetical protein ACFOY2_54150 [Nonomuraea purpurea]|uniref:DUF4158 domain-containing protein n=1 Tax=Nonomuraea purpurea TaxID=1849276 RepID=A0ABV8GU24_9ACTN
MVAQVFTDQELEALRQFPEIGREELFRFFTLRPDDEVARWPTTMVWRLSDR